LSIEVGFNRRHLIYGNITESLSNEDYQWANAFKAFENLRRKCSDVGLPEMLLSAAIGEYG
jgi:hypothetical protein